MPSISNLKTIAGMSAGAGLGGFGGYKYARGRDDFDTEDKLGFAASSAIAGAAGGLALRAIGLGRLGSMAGGTAKAGAFTGKMLMANPARSIMRKMGRQNFGYKSIPKPIRTAGLIGATAVAGIAAIAYSSRSKPQTSAYASQDEYGETQYSAQSTRERMGMLGATGDMVFGLNNSRHG